MLDADEYVAQGLKTVDQLVDRGDLITALKVCEELIRVHPYHTGAQKYFANIHAKIVKQNESIVDQDIQKTMKLWDEHRYDELRAIYAKLLTFSPHHKKLHDLIIKLDATVGSEAKKEREAMKQKAFSAIATLVTEKRFTEAIQACDELKDYFPGDESVIEIGKKTRYALIDQKLFENAHLQGSADFAQSEDFYLSLLQIEPTHPQTKKLLEQTRAHGTRQKLLDSKIHLNESIERMKKLWNTREYEKVLQACDEILQQDPHNFTGNLFKNKALSTMARESDILELKQLKQHAQEMGAAYKKDPTSYVKL